MRVNNLLNVIYYELKKWRLRDLNLRPTDPETNTLTTQPTRLTSLLKSVCYLLNIINFIDNNIDLSASSKRPSYTIKRITYGTRGRLLKGCVSHPCSFQSSQPY